jgi:Secretion system C-terminal sorting domain
MKINFTIILLLFSAIMVPITAVNTSGAVSATNFSYVNGANTYNWRVSPNNSTTLVNGFTAVVPYTYASFLTGTVRLRRVNNANISGNFTLVWAEAVTAGNVFNMLPAYENDMESFFNNRIYNKGTDNFFDNTSGNSNNIERLDWIIPTGYSNSLPDRVGFAIFERGAVGVHDPFCIAAITSLDAMGNPASYGNIVRVTSSNYADPGPAVTYRILKAPFPNDLIDAGTATQSRGGVIISLQNLGIAANSIIYGYSLFSNDLPGSATPANLVDVTNPTYFPLNTGNPGGIDLIAVTGIYIATSVLSTRFVSFDAFEKSDLVNLKWTVENEQAVARYEIERSTDGNTYTTVHQLKPGTTSSNGTNVYSFDDPVQRVFSSQLYYRIKQYSVDGSVHYSKVIFIKRNNKSGAVSVYPNPVSENLLVNIAHNANERATISVVNNAGAEVLQLQVTLAKGNNAFTLEEISKLSKGNYRLVVKSQSGKLIAKQFSKQ